MAWLGQGSGVPPMLLAGACLVVSACATPYQAKGFGGGYTDTPVGSGRHQITVEGNGYTSRSTLISHFHRRAAELCGGDYNVDSQDILSDQVVNTITRHTVTGIVSCDSSDYIPASRRPARTARRYLASEGRSAPPSELPAPSTDCQKDTDCKGARICERGVCTAEPGSAQTVAPVAPTPEPSAPESAAVSINCKSDRLNDCYRLAMRLERAGGDGSEIAITDALKTACDSDHGPSCERLGRAYERGELDVANNAALARLYYRKACSAGVASACEPPG